MIRRLAKKDIIPALIAGAVAGAAMVAAWTGFPLFLRSQPNADALTLLTFSVAILVWAGGLALVGAPLWAVLHARGLRSAAHAVAVGAVATFLASAILLLLLPWGMGDLNEGGRWIIQDGARTPYGWWVLLRSASLMALSGALVGLLIWRIAYRREGAS